MSDDFDLDQDAEENEPDEQAGTVETTADPQVAKLLKELKETRKENQTLRSRSNEWLVEKFGQDIVEAIPAEVKAYEARLSLAEKIHGLTNQTPQTEQATDAGSQEEPTAVEKALAAVGQGPSTSGASGLPLDMTAKQILELGKTDPNRADQIMQAKYRTP